MAGVVLERAAEASADGGEAIQRVRERTRVASADDRTAPDLVGPALSAPLHPGLRRYDNGPGFLMCYRPTITRVHEL